jgi:hypothetical protein
MNKDDVLDSVETMLAYLICGESKDISKIINPNPHRNVTGEEFDIGEILNFEPMLPKQAYTCVEDDRLVACDHNLLLNTPQDILGESSEIVLLSDGMVKWSGYRKLKKRPHNVWVSSPNASLYEWHYREIYLNGMESYGKRIVAFSKHGRPVTALVSGSKGGAGNDSLYAVFAASVIEDAHRPNVLKATVKDSTSLVFPVPLGEHKEIFALRDAPLTASGRKKAILHWVKKYTRKNVNVVADVKQHWRGVREIEIDNFSIKLEETKSPT